MKVRVGISARVTSVRGHIDVYSNYRDDEAYIVTARTIFVMGGAAKRANSARREGPKASPKPSFRAPGSVDDAVVG